MIVTIDGPAGAGKSSAARGLAQKLGYRFLDTGAMYRAVTYAAMQAGIDLTDPDALLEVARRCEIELGDSSVLLNGEDVTDRIRTFEITTATRHAADHAGIREILVGWQRETAEGCHIVTEGRDQSTVVFPYAECKIFLTASEEVRAERRYRDLLGRGESVTPAEVLQKQQQRDDRDCSRAVGALTKAEDAIEVNTDGLTPQQVIDRLLEIVQSQPGFRPTPQQQPSSSI